VNRPAPAAAVFGAGGPQLATIRHSSQGFTQPRRHRRAGPFSNSLTLGGGTGVAGSLSIDPGTAAGVTRNLGNQIHDNNGTPGSLTKVGDGTLPLRKRLIRRSGASAEPMGFGTVRAWLDRCDGTRVAGWAQDKADPDATVCLDIVVDGRIVAMTVAALYRADIAAAGVGDGRHGFDLGLATPLAPGAPHVVEVRRSVDDAVICAIATDAAGLWTPLLAA
jgi:hypothetical protein